MTNQEVFALIKPMGALTYSTVHGDEVHSRVAGIVAADDGGFYFFSLRNKPFARQLLSTGRVTICGSYTPPCEPNPAYRLRPGYAIRLIGEVREVPEAEVRKKAKNNPSFRKLIEYDYARYPDTITFVLYKGKGEIFDYDFNLEKRDHKLIRTRFSIGGGSFNPAGFKINDNCTG
ncbi:MAG TPA: pyridoxine-5-phosphate oxidase, partial [Firmicutes bacterium]|nr:pyridoxine-5-phosphate oxidase [Bacillota bacterium]